MQGLCQLEITSYVASLGKRCNGMFRARSNSYDYLSTGVIKMVAIVEKCNSRSFRSTLGHRNIMMNAYLNRNEILVLCSQILKFGPDQFDQILFEVLILVKTAQILILLAPLSSPKPWVTLYTQKD